MANIACSRRRAVETTRVGRDRYLNYSFCTSLKPAFQISIARDVSKYTDVYYNYQSQMEQIINPKFYHPLGFVTLPAPAKEK